MSKFALSGLADLICFNIFPAPKVPAPSLPSLPPFLLHFPSPTFSSVMVCLSSKWPFMNSIKPLNFEVPKNRLNPNHFAFSYLLNELTDTSILNIKLTRDLFWWYWIADLKGENFRHDVFWETRLPKTYLPNQNRQGEGLGSSRSQMSLRCLWGSAHLGSPDLVNCSKNNVPCGVRGLESNFPPRVCCRCHICVYTGWSPW